MTHTARITDDWLPIPDSVLGGLQWREGDTIELEIVGDCVVLKRLLEAPAKAPKT